MSSSFQGKTVLITGASRGIGRATALYFASHGADIAVNYVRNEEAARRTLDDIRKLGVRAEIHQANVGNPQDLDGLIEFVTTTFGRLDILIHNAALGAFKPVHKLKLNQWQLSLDTNAQAFLLLTQKALPLLETSGHASVIALSSLGAQKFIPNYGAIGISKAALECLVRYLAVELAPRGIRVNCVSGGPVDTDALKYFPDYEDLKREVVGKTPAGRLGKPEDLAKVVGFLASPEASWIYGQTIIADGGISLH